MLYCCDQVIVSRSGDSGEYPGTYLPTQAMMYLYS